MSGRDLFDYRPEWFEEEAKNGGEESSSKSTACNTHNGGDGGSGEDGTENGGWHLDKMRSKTEEGRERMEREEEERMDGSKKGFDAATLDD
jgi:hypothetical protein